MLKIGPDIWKAGLRTAAAAGISQAVAQLLGLPQGYWAVISAIVIMQANLGASLEAAADRLVGTLAGAILGLAVAYVTPSTPGGTLFGLVLATGLLAMLATRNSSFRIAPVTAAILLIAAPSHADASISALHRVTEISLGCFIGIAVSLLIAPSRAEARLKNEVSHVLALLGNLITEQLEGKVDDEQVAATTSDIYAAYESINKLTKETEKEHATRLARGAFDARRLRRSLLDLRANVFFLRRVTGADWPKTLGDDLAKPTTNVAEAARDYLLALGQSLPAGEQPPPLDGLESAFTRFFTAAADATARAEASSAPVDPNTPEGTLSFLSTFSFALEQLRSSIEELVECVRALSNSADDS